MGRKTTGYAALSAKEPLKPFHFERRNLGEDDIALDIAFAGICHSDIHTVRDEWGHAMYPCVPGHEIVGHVTEIGAGVTNFAVGERIGVGVFVDSCRECEPCKNNQQQYCDKGMTGTYNGFERDGKQVAYGGYSKEFVIHKNYAYKIPAHLDLAGVAPLLCAGVTLWSPINYFKVGPGKKVAILGLGGLGHMGVKFAHALGAEVTVLSHSAKKEEDAKKLGADHFVHVENAESLKSHYREYDLILNTTSALIDLGPYLDSLAINGTMVIIGLPEEPYKVSAFNLLSGRKSLTGSMIGGTVETQAMLDFCGAHNIVSEIELISADYINTAYERTVASDVRYRFVIDAATF